jgi:hypothetical protein
MKMRYLLASGLALVSAYTAGRTKNRPRLGLRQRLPVSEIEAGAAARQELAPIEQINLYLDGFHFQNGDPKQQLEAYHYCMILNEDVMQCVIYDGNEPDAKLVGLEYIISEKLFQTLPEEEQPLWHSHAYEVKSGQLVAPGVPGPAELELMEKLQSSYGKMWHTWDTSDPAKALPLGIPKLMMGFTGEGQLDPSLLADRDQRLEISTEEKRKRRADLPALPPVEGADAWQRGHIVQLEVHPKGRLKRPPKVGQRTTTKRAAAVK